MASITIRNMDDEVKARLRTRAAENGRSMEAEARLDLNPIEQAFAKLKALLRKAGPRSPSDLCRVIGECLDAFRPDECVNFFRNAGYDSNQS